MRVCVFCSLLYLSRTVHLNRLYVSTVQWCVQLYLTRTKCMLNESLCYCLFNGSTLQLQQFFFFLSLNCHILFLKSNKLKERFRFTLRLCVFVCDSISDCFCLFDFRFYWNLSHFNEFVTDDCEP